MKSFTFLILLAIGLLPLYLRNAWSFSLGSDEPESLYLAGLTWYQYLVEGQGFNQAPLFFKLIDGVMGFAGQSKALLRSLSVGFSILSIPALYFLILERCNSKGMAALVAAVVLTNPLVVEYGQLIRPGALYFFLITLNLYFFVKVADSQKARGLEIYSFGVTAFCALLTHYTYLPFFCLQVFFLNFLKWREKCAVSLRDLTMIAAICLIQPLRKILLLVDYTFDQSHLVDRSLTGPLADFSSLFFNFSLEYLNLKVALLGLVLLFFCLILFHKKTRSIDRFFAFAPLASFVGFVVVALSGHNHILARYFIFLMPLFAWQLVAVIQNVNPGIYRAVLYLTLVFMSVIQFTSSWLFLTPKRYENYEAAAKLVAETSGPVVVCAPFSSFYVARYLSYVIEYKYNRTLEPSLCEEAGLPIGNTIFYVDRNSKKEKSLIPTSLYRNQQTFDYSGDWIHLVVTRINPLVKK